jgi:hypothetical protein
MKKIIVNEQQIKKIIRSTINEQTENEKLIMAVQCFLNKKYKANLVVDGASGKDTKTEKLLMRFQQEKLMNGEEINVDGAWGEETMSSLSEPELEVFRDCVSETGGIMDKIVHFLHLD